MITVLRIQGDQRRLRDYAAQINRVSVAAKAHMDRAGRVVADLSKRKDDWSAHVREIIDATEAMRSILLLARDAGDQCVVDTGFYATSEFKDGVAVTMDSYIYPPMALRHLADLSLSLEVTIHTIRPD